MRRSVETVDHHDYLVGDAERGDSRPADLRLGQRLEDLVVQVAPVRRLMPSAAANTRALCRPRS